MVLVRVMGLEPIRRLTHAPQTCLSAYSSTLAYRCRFLRQRYYYSRSHPKCQVFFLIFSKNFSKRFFSHFYGDFPSSVVGDGVLDVPRCFCIFPGGAERRRVGNRHALREVFIEFSLFFDIFQDHREELPLPRHLFLCSHRKASSRCFHQFRPPFR